MAEALISDGPGTGACNSRATGPTPTSASSILSSKIAESKAQIVGEMHFAYYNLCWTQKALGVTPAMEVGITTKVWSLGGAFGVG